jgi:dTDP-4-dehydrorhamnose 3,5-epimerase
MQITATELAGVFLIEPRLFEDERGYFLETYHRQRFAEAGIDVEFVQDNFSHSRRGVLRGLHYQIQHPQGKLVRVVRGEIFDVAVDLRRDSPTFGRWTAAVLSETNHRQLYIAPGFAHGFCVTSDAADVIYKCTDFYAPQHERTLLWNDPALGIEWPVGQPLVSPKDRAGLPLATAETYVG